VNRSFFECQEMFIQLINFVLLLDKSLRYHHNQGQSMDLILPKSYHTSKVYSSRNRFSHNLLYCDYLRLRQPINIFSLKFSNGSCLLPIHGPVIGGIKMVPQISCFRSCLQDRWIYSNVICVDCCKNIFVSLVRLRVFFSLREDSFFVCC